jgi:transcription termination factor Rho
MDPSDNFSQKKKKDLVAIATLFGILTEDQANRMTKPELIDILVTQERVSRSSDIPAVNNAPSVTGRDSDTVQSSLKTPSKKAATPRVKKKPDTSSVESVTEPVQPLSESQDSSASPVESKSVKKTSGRPAKARQELAPVLSIISEGDDASKKEAASSPDDSDNNVKNDGKGTKSKRKKPAANKVPLTPSPEVLKSVPSEPEKQDTLENTGAKKQRPSGRQKRSGALTKSTPETEGSEGSTEVFPLPADSIQGQAEDTATLPAIEVPAPIMDQASGQDPKANQDQIDNQELDRPVPLSDESEKAVVFSEDNLPEPAKPRTDISRQSSEKPSGHARSKHRSVIIKPKNEPAAEDTDAIETPEILESETPREEETTSERPHHRSERSKESNQEILSGVLEIMQEGYGFLRRENYLQGQNDIFVAAQYIRRFNLRVGDFVSGPCRPRRESERYQALQYIKEVNGLPPEKMIRRPAFDRLTPIYPDQRFVLETEKIELSTRIIDLIAPIGKGQRGMIVSPPKAGKTILLQKIANAISINNPESKLIVLLIDERPEEVTDMQRSINGEVVYSTFDKTPENHVKITELVLERAMRLVELGQDVVILLDSITRMSRAYNLTINPTGRTLSGGLDPGALYGPKRFFGAARNIENGGSLTIIATSLIDTGSRMDEVIFEEFKGTGNMEVYLDRKLSEKRIFPAIDINKSGTRREELLLTQLELDAVWTIRKALGQLDTAAVTEMIISLLLKTTGNSQFVSSVNVSFNDKATFEAMRGTRLTGNGSSQGTGQQGGK